ncbi:hypothetical protein BOTBODRAFT_109093 [Botryobasidium botryosum FD-172 SS1]|uniref:Uncharacterized protein n=1 Tax=Botryobasidium botryosum (strain FD-172 SS1) TaxID=930990 RepID=A0A067MTF6_BOTB1|nr:hypothetical protein BOTBODRAFT_109093 [Botryobasidium botryosum FD-172 SS1]
MQSPPLGWIDPRIGGGRMIDYATPRLGEPLNVIISAASDPEILSEHGFHQYAKSLGFSGECLGMHMGVLHLADLGDGLGRRTEQYLARQHYYFPVWGTCWESVAGKCRSVPRRLHPNCLYPGGNHFRAWKQNGTNANTGAWFLAYFIGQHHIITSDGYNQGRNSLVSRAFEGGGWKGVWWKADVEWRSGLIEPGTKGINHAIPQDGLVAVLTVNRVPSGPGSRISVLSQFPSLFTFLLLLAFNAALLLSIIRLLTIPVTTS